MSTSVANASLTVVDYIVFGSLLAVSAAVGIFFAYRDRRKKNSENYLLGNRKISWWASGISCSLSFFSGATIIGYPAEIMYRGSPFMWVVLALIISNIVGCEMFLPIYYKNDMSSANEYVGRRFGKYARYAATLIYILQTVAYTGVMIYAPALAFNAVSDLSLFGAVLSIGIVCTIYTTLGGLKAVIWTDVLQSFVLIIVLLFTLFISANEVGGFAESVEIAVDGGRVDFNHFELDPRYRMTFWSAVFGLGVMWSSITCTNQAVVQRFLCCRSVREGKKAIYSTIFVSVFQFGFLITFLGYVTYAYFATCDPLVSKQISAADQVLPLMVMEVFSDAPGVPGLFVAGVFAGALSTISSAINGLTCVTSGDIIRPIVKWSDHTMLWIARGLTFVYGALCIGFAVLSSALGGVVQATLSLVGVCAGSLLGPVVMGALFPIANEKGAIAGMIAALSFNTWLFIGATMYPPPLQFLNMKPLSVDGCQRENINASYILNMSTILVTDTTISEIITISNQMATSPSINEATISEIMTISNQTPTSSSINERPAIAEFYAISFCYYAPLGLIVCLIVGLFVSALTGGLKSRYDVSPDLICLPFEHPTMLWLPASFRQYMIPKMGEKEEDSFDQKLADEEAYCLSKQKYDESSYTKPDIAKDDVWILNNNSQI